MTQYEALIRVVETSESDAAGVRRDLDERLRTAGFDKWRIVGVWSPGTVERRLPSRRRRMRPQATYYAGGLLLVAAVAWSLWLLWILAG